MGKGMNTLHNITQQLSQLDLMHCDENLVSNIISQIPTYALPILHIPKGSCFIRATSLEMNEKVTVGRLSYKPKNKDDKDDKFQRATICGETIFYSVLQNPTQNRGVTDARALSLAEACWFFREKNVPDGVYRATISEWRTTADLNICAMLNIRGTNKSQWFQQMKNEGVKKMQEHYKQDDFEVQADFQEFIASQFRKHVKEGKNNEYMISAYYTHHLRSLLGCSLAGVCYESAVNIDEKLNNSLCAAIFPEFVDSYLLPPKEYLDCTLEICNNKCNSICCPKPI